MKPIITGLIIALCCCAATAQTREVGMKLSTTSKGYSYNSFTFPNDILVFKMDKSKHYLKSEGLTVIQVWTLNNGSQPQFWDQIENLRKTYKDQGLEVISVNFENGAGFHRQYANLQKFFDSVKEPENFYFDSMGYITDLLQVPGFPSYFLIDKGEVVFYTLGEDNNGVQLLEGEIIERLKEKK